jgi:hypothetical protein
VSEAKRLLNSVSTKKRRPDNNRGTLPDPLPWAAIAGPWGHAEESLARLDQTLAMSALNEARTTRADAAFA